MWCSLRGRLTNDLVLYSAGRRLLCEVDLYIVLCWDSVYHEPLNVLGVSIANI